MGDCCYSTTTATPTVSHTAPPFQYIYGSVGVHWTCSYSQVRAAVESVFSRDRCFSDGAFGNLVHRNCNRAGDSSCCITTRWALPNRKHLHMYIYKLWLVSMQQQKKCLQTKRISWLPPMFFFFFCMSYTMIEIYHENDRIYVSCWLLRVMVAKMHASEHHGGYKARFRASWWL